MHETLKKRGGDNLWNFLSTSSNGHKVSPPLSLNFNTNSCTTENVGRLITPAKKLEDTIRLAELVIEVLQQNEEHHAEVSRCQGGRVSRSSEDAAQLILLATLWIRCLNSHFLITDLVKQMKVAILQGGSFTGLFKTAKKWVLWCTFQLEFSDISSNKPKRWVYLWDNYSSSIWLLSGTYEILFGLLWLFLLLPLLFWFILFGVWIESRLFEFISVT